MEYDMEFFKQATRLKFWATYESFEYKPRLDEELHKPKLGDNTARKYIRW